jgi:ABC-type phosphate/phosphonate transport system permease subunit
VAHLKPKKSFKEQSWIQRSAGCFSVAPWQTLVVALVATAVAAVAAVAVAAVAAVAVAVA